MNYELVKIVNEAGREFAYLLEKTTGRVIKTTVEDHTGNAAGTVRMPTRPVPMPDRELPHFVDVPRDAFASGHEEGPARPMVPRGFKAVAAPRPDLPDKPQYQPPPPGIAGVFGGTAEEKRTA